MAASLEIDVWQGEIAELEVDAIVVGASESLFMTAAVAAAVKRRGGASIERDAVDQGPIAPGGVVATSGGTLATPYIIHAVAVGHDRVADPERLTAAVRGAVALAEPLRLRRVAFALLGVEHGAFTAADAADLLVSALVEPATGTQLESVVIATAHADETRAVADAVARHRATVA